MEPYLCLNGDYLFLITWKEFIDLKEGPLEATLLFDRPEEDESLAKEIEENKVKAKLSYNPSLEKTITLKHHPEGALGWYNIKVVELIINEKAMNEFRFSEVFFESQAVGADAGRAYYVREKRPEEPFEGMDELEYFKKYVCEGNEERIKSFEEFYKEYRSK